MKLKGLPKIVYLNAKQDSAQNQLMIEHFDHYGIKDYIRHEKKYTTQVKDSSSINWNDILSDDYSDDGACRFVTGSFDHSYLLENELALTLDNYDAIVNWYENTDDEVCIIMDDIVRLHTSNYWMFDWEYAYKRLPYNWDCIQLFVNSASQKIPMNLHPWQREHRSTRCYMISRLFAKKIKRFHYPDGKFKLPGADARKYPANPEDGYGWEKLFSERMCRHFMEDYGIQVRIARYHNIYGPFGTYDGGREKAPAAICRKVIDAKLNNRKEIDVWGDGKQTRTFLFIDDCLDGTIRLFDSNYSEPVNIGSDEQVSINQMIDMIENIAEHKVKRNYQLDKPKGVRGRSSDNQKIKN